MTSQVARPVGNYKLQSEFQYQSLRYASHPPFPGLFPP